MRTDRKEVIVAAMGRCTKLFTSYLALALGVALLATCGNHNARRAPRAVVPAAPVPPRGAVYGRALDSETGLGVPGLWIFAYPDSIKLGAGSAISDEDGHYEIKMPLGTGSIGAVNFGSPWGTGMQAVSATTPVAFQVGPPLLVDIQVDHAALVAQRTKYPPLACPHSPPGTVVEGHTLSQRDLDDVVYGVLQRFATDRKSIEDFHVKDLRLVRVRTQQRVDLRASTAAFPLVRGTRFVDMTLAELKAEATETQKAIAYISFGHVSSDGTCAVLEVGGDVVYPDETSHTKYGCSEKALWERVNGRWMFAQSVYSICG